MRILKTPTTTTDHRSSAQCPPHLQMPSKWPSASPHAPSQIVDDDDSRLKLWLQCLAHRAWLARASEGCNKSHVPSLLHAFLDSPGPSLWWRMQHPKLGTQQSVLIRDSFIHDSFMEDSLLSVWDQLLLALSFTRSEEACSEEQRTIISRRWSMQCDGCVF